MASTIINFVDLRGRRASPRLGALLGIAVVMIGLLWPSVAAAQTGAACDQVVVDRSGTIADTAALTNRAQATGEALHAQVRVRVEERVDGADADRYESGLEAACPAWRDGNQRARDLLVVVVATADRKTGVYYGRDLADRLRDRYLSVQNDTMNPKFQRGDFAGGLDAGLSQLGAGPGSESSTSVVAIVLIALMGFAGAVVFVALVVVSSRKGGGKGGGPGGSSDDQSRSAQSAASIAAMTAATSSSIASTAGGGSTSW
jgi:hypothetical protein